MRTLTIAISAALAATLHTANALAAEPATIYKSMDENGALVFSDSPPENEAQAIEVIEINTPEPVSEAVYRQRLQDMRETTDRLVAERHERERLRAELNATQADSQQTPAAAPEVEHSASDNYFYPIPLYYPYPRFHQQRRSDHPRPPRATTQHGIVPGNNGQLMRPILPRAPIRPAAD